MPTKGALTQARERISYHFFETQFNAIKSDFNKRLKVIMFTALMAIFIQ
jgi:hypothetical protein